VSSGEPIEAPSKQALALYCVEVLGQLAGLFEERRRQLAESVGLSVGQWQVLEEIQETHFMPSMFAQKRASSAAAVSKVLRQLSDKGLIFANVSESDARKRNYEVTAEGQAMLSQVRTERERAIDEIWLKLSKEELEQFSNVGRQLVQRLDHWAKEADPKRTSSSARRTESKHDSDVPERLS
jgi:DNA-binding MarR family transcriptional regulator